MRYWVDLDKEISYKEFVVLKKKMEKVFGYTAISEIKADGVVVAKNIHWNLAEKIAKGEKE